MSEMGKATKATYTTGAAMAKNFEVYAGPGKIEVRTVAGYGVIYIDKERQEKAAIPGSDWNFDVNPGPHHVAVEMGGQLLGNKIVDVPAEGDAVMLFAIDQPATDPPQEETAEQPKPEEPAEQTEPEQPAPTEEPAPEQPEPEQPTEDPQPEAPKLPEYASIKTENLTLLIEELRELADYFETLLPKPEAEPKPEE